MKNIFPHQQFHTHSLHHQREDDLFEKIESSVLRRLSCDLNEDDFPQCLFESSG